ncbi:lysophospholipid acyltransferase family protein [Dietzia alimentaria]|uniref:lysophospholipid acyltransferase family protein n=1 Tax=Dietzia alimentaria TaxID=665550 RepID=UPI0005280128|nr:lysophospholipid acyltransferase family protein [Dietzia alimentaria]
MELLYTGIIGFARTMFKVQGLDLTVRGERHFPERGGAVVVINHTGYFDFVYGGIPARVHKRFIRYMAKVEVFDHKISGPIMRELKHIPVDRTAGKASFDEAVNRLRAGELVGVFPEATISRSFEVKEFKTGAVRMALAADVPIITVTLWGSQRVWTKGLPKKLLRPKVPIMMQVGVPMKAYEPVEECTQEIRSRMQATLERMQQEYAQKYGPYPAGASWVPARLGGSAPTLDEATALDEAEHAERMRLRAEKAASEGTAALDDPDVPKGPAGPGAP